MLVTIMKFVLVNDSDVVCSVIDNGAEDVSSDNEGGVGDDNDTDLVTSDTDDGTDDIRMNFLVWNLRIQYVFKIVVSDTINAI